MGGETGTKSKAVFHLLQRSKSNANSEKTASFQTTSNQLTVDWITCLTCSRINLDLIKKEQQNKGAALFYTRIEAVILFKKIKWKASKGKEKELAFFPLR